MCGIAGFWKKNGLAPDDESHLRGMIKAINHRGPDGQGYHLDGPAGLALGHARLSIIDLQGGHQPILADDKNLALVVNGEFYDYQKIRATLSALGETFHSKSDSELALQLYRRMGEDFIHELRGEFAFALFDKKRRRLILARDRFGIRPLFYHIGAEGFHFASEIKSLFEVPSIPRKYSAAGVLHQLMHTMVPGTSAYEGIHALEPGQMLIVEQRAGQWHLEKRKYWDFAFPKNADRPKQFAPEDYIGGIRDGLIESVLLRLVADVPVGCYLSGGIDSCCILGLASAASQNPIKAFTISFDHDSYDESTIAAEMARKCGAEQELIRLAAGELYGVNYIRTAWHAERTFYNTLGVAKWCMSRRVRQCGYKTVQTGEGSDELFGGYPAFKRDMFKHGLSHLPASEREEYQRQLEQSNQIFKGAILAEDDISHPAFDQLCGFTPSWIQPWMGTLQIARPLLADSLQKELEGYDPIEAIVDALDPDMIEGRHPLDIAQYTWSKTMLEGQILNWGGDRVDMANSMESRPAFLDHRLAERAAQVPPSLRIKGNTEKWVLREAVRGVLPEVLYKREKFAFMAPPAHTDETKQKAVETLIKEYLSEESIQRAGVLDAGRVDRFLSEYRQDTDPVSLTRKDALLNHLLCVHILDRHLIGKEPLPSDEG